MLDLIKNDETSIVEVLLLLADRFDLCRYIVDVGANKNAEVSTPFISAQWQALLIEPQQYCCEQLKKTFGSNVAVSIFNCACSKDDGQGNLFWGTDGIGCETATLNKNEDPWTKDAVSASQFEVVTIRTLTSILAEAGAPRDFGILKIDTESWDYEVLLGLNFSRYRPRVVVTEEYLWRIAATQGKHELLEGVGYVNIGFVGFNSIWIDKSAGVKWCHNAIGAWLAACGVDLLPDRVRTLTHSFQKLVNKSRVHDEIDYLQASYRLSVERMGTKFYITLTNFSGFTLPSLPSTDGGKGIVLSYHLLKNGKVCLWDGLRTNLPADILPMQAIVIDAQVDLTSISEDVEIVFCIVQEGVDWVLPSSTIGSSCTLRMLNGLPQNV